MSCCGCKTTSILKQWLTEVFPRKKDEEYLDMIEALERLKVNGLDDLQYLNEESLKESEKFADVEIKKLLDVARNPELKTLNQVLLEIFNGASAERLKEIVIYLKDRGVYKGKDILIVDMSSLKKELAPIEIGKIKQYIRKNDKNRGEELLFDEQQKRDRKARDQQFQSKKRDILWEGLIKEKQDLQKECAMLEKNQIEIKMGSERHDYMKILMVLGLTLGSYECKSYDRCSALSMIQSLLDEKKNRIIRIDEEINSFDETSKRPPKSQVSKTKELY